MLVGQINITLSPFHTTDVSVLWMVHEKHHTSEIHVEKQIWVTPKWNENLFRKEFCEQISETEKAQKKSKWLLASTVFKDTANENQPFRKGHPPSKQHRWGTVLTCAGVQAKEQNMQMKRTFFKEIPPLIPREKLPYANKLVKRLFSSGQLSNVQTAGTLKHFVKN